MRQSIVVLVALIAAVTIGSPAAEAVKYCAPLPVGSGLPTCKCAIQNYSTVTDAGITITVYPGTVVTFVNQDSVNHDIASNPHPTHTDCPEINQVGSLTPGQSKQTAAFGASRSVPGV